MLLSSAWMTDWLAACLSALNWLTHVEVDVVLVFRLLFYWFYWNGSVLWIFMWVKVKYRVVIGERCFLIKLCCLRAYFVSVGLGFYFLSDQQFYINFMVLKQLQIKCSRQKRSQYSTITHSIQKSKKQTILNKRESIQIRGRFQTPAIIPIKECHVI